MGLIRNVNVRNAFLLGGLCSISYLSVYFARNILGTVTPQMIESGLYTAEYIGKVSSLYFIFYAVGQLINGILGDKIKARYMISGGLFFAAITNILFSRLSAYPNVSMIVYGMTGFFLAMIYGPMTKVVAENTLPAHAVRCSLGYTFASFFGSPLAGIVAAVLVWYDVFAVGSSALFVMAVACFVCFLIFEKKGIVKYNQFDKPKEKNGGNIKILIEQKIVRFTLISILTGVIRTSVVFWMPTYIAQYLGFSADMSATIFTFSTFIISLETFIAIFIYERICRSMDKTILLMFMLSTLFFSLTYILKIPVLNIVCLTAGIMCSNGAATMLWSIYCVGLRDTGMTSGATGFLDFVSYVAAAISSIVFANAVDGIGWGNLILVWTALMVIGVIISLPYDKILGREVKW
ncbi:MAG: MFS transporter [Clostridia bacterium]|nr:MFS transporter [Clostridia bacterium]